MEITSHTSIKSATKLANNRTKVVSYFNTYAKHYAHEHYSPTSSSLNNYRYRIVLDMISRLELKKNSTTLDIGCGPGHLAIELARMGFDSQGIDISSEMIRIAEDVAKAFFHLATSKKTTGAVLTVDGGNIAASLR